MIKMLRDMPRLPTIAASASGPTPPLGRLTAWEGVGRDKARLFRRFQGALVPLRRLDASRLKT
jgi:hypothetical protein